MSNCETLKILIENVMPKASILEYQVLAAVVGGAIALLSSFLLNIYNNHREDKIHLKTKKEEVYEQLLKIIIPIYNSWILNGIDKNTERKPFNIEEIEILLNIYGSKKVLKTFDELPLTHWEVSSKTIDTIQKLKKQIRNELGIKE
jgi:hypothetical protein